MKIIHWIAIFSLILAVGLLVAGLPKIAALMLGLSVLIELLFSAFTGKRTNDGVN